MNTIESLVPARMDRLPWSRFHWLIVLALGITWVLDGLEVTLVGAVSGILGSRQTLALTPAQIGLLASWYIIGAVGGALVFGWATDRFGRRRLFFITLGVYLAGVLLSAAAVVEAAFGIDAERRGLESLASPLSTEELPAA